jgi:hypothetical protein
MRIVTRCRTARPYADLLELLTRDRTSTVVASPDQATVIRLHRRARCSASARDRRVTRARRPLGADPIRRPGGGDFSSNAGRSGSRCRCGRWVWRPDECAHVELAAQEAAEKAQATKGSDKPPEAAQSLTDPLVVPSSSTRESYAGLCPMRRPIRSLLPRSRASRSQAVLCAPRRHDAGYRQPRRRQASENLEHSETIPSLSRSARPWRRRTSAQRPSP